MENENRPPVQKAGIAVYRYGPEFRSVMFRIPEERPHTFIDWFWMAWGMDVWAGPIPVMKLFTFINAALVVATILWR